MPELTLHPFTSVGWNVDDIAPVILKLNARGVYYEMFAFMDQDDLGVWAVPGGAKVALFKEVRGNICR